MSSSRGASECEVSYQVPEISADVSYTCIVAGPKMDLHGLQQNRVNLQQTLAESLKGPAHGPTGREHRRQCLSGALEPPELRLGVGPGHQDRGKYQHSPQPPQPRRLAAKGKRGAGRYSLMPASK